MKQRHLQFMKAHALWICLAFSSISAFSQTVAHITLDSCVDLAVKNYPLFSHAENLQAMSDNNIKSINAEMLPQLTMVAKASYQSEATEFDYPGFMTLAFPKDNYSFGLQINQVLYDFGKFNQSKAVEEAQTTSEIQKNEIAMYGVRTTVVQLYSKILLVKENINILNSYIENVKARYSDMQLAVANGVVLQSNLDILFAEMQRTNQKLVEASTNLSSLEQSLSLYTRTEFDTATVFTAIDQSGLFLASKAERPELKYYESQQKLLDEQITLETRKKTPRLYLYGEGAYGRTGYDMMNEDFRLYGIAGIGLQWNLNSLHTHSITSRNLTISKNLIEEQKSLFELKQNTELVQHQKEIEKFTHLIEMDASIIEKYQNITATSADQLENGIITSTDYLTQLYAQKQAELNQMIHKIQLRLAVVNYNLTAGTN